jgi:hypothetical protein
LVGTAGGGDWTLVLSMAGEVEGETSMMLMERNLLQTDFAQNGMRCEWVETRILGTRSELIWKGVQNKTVLRTWTFKFTKKWVQRNACDWKILNLWQTVLGYQGRFVEDTHKVRIYNSTPWFAKKNSWQHIFTSLEFLP